MPDVMFGFVVLFNHTAAVAPQIANQNCLNITQHNRSKSSLLAPCDVFNPWVRWETGGWDPRVCLGPAVESGNLES